MGDKYENDKALDTERIHKEDKKKEAETVSYKEASRKVLELLRGQIRREIREKRIQKEKKRNVECIYPHKTKKKRMRGISKHRTVLIVLRGIGGK